IGTEHLALFGAAFPRMVDEDLPHHPGRDAEEVRAVFPAHVWLPDQPQIGLMNEGGGLQRVIPSFAPHVRARSTTELSMDGDEESLPIVRRAGPPTPEQS